MDAQLPGPTPESLRTMMQMAAATASAAAGDANVLAHQHHTPRHVRQHTSRSSHNRRQSISQLPQILGTSPLPKGAPLPTAADGARWRRILAVAAEISSKWVHPPESNQYETETLHHVRAILYMSKAFITQSFVSHVSGVSQGSLSHYVRGLFRGNQQNVEDRLSQFVRKFAAGELDPFLDEARAATRPLARSVVMEAAAATMTTPSSATAAPSPPQPVIQPETTIQHDARPPVPPPPPPQLQPAPWQQRPTPPRPPPLPVEEPKVVETETESVSKEKEVSPVMTERAKRARQRQLMQIRRKSGMTPFTMMLDDMQDPTPVTAVERAFHALVTATWNSEPTHVEPLLLPIELFVGEGELHMFTQWDVNERVLSPEIVAERIKRARMLGDHIVQPVAMQIRRALFEAGIVCAPPPGKGEERRLIRICVGVGGRVLRDEFEWDLGMGMMNSPEGFAQHLCADAGVSQKYATVVAAEIREKLCCAHAIAYGDEETKKRALQGLGSDDPLRNSLENVKSAIRGGEGRERAKRVDVECDVEDWFVLPILEEVVKEAERRKVERVKKGKEEADRKELEVLREREREETEERRRKLEEALRDVDDAAVRLQEARGLDFRPYLNMKLGGGERPGVWTPGVFDRKRRRQTSFPMLQTPKVQHGLIQSGGRSARRRKASRRGEEGGKGVKRELEMEDEDKREGMKVPLVLRVRERKGGSVKKRRKK